MPKKTDSAAAKAKASAWTFEAKARAIGSEDKAKTWPRGLHH